MRMPMSHHRKLLVIKYLVAVIGMGFVTLAGSRSVQAEVPILNSAPEATHVIYLDFDGHFEPRSPHTCPPPLGSAEGWPIDIDIGDISTDIDADSVRRIWEAVAEDFAPFFVNVTTDPAREPYRDSDTGSAVRIAVGISSIENSLGLSPAVCDVDTLANPPYLNPRIANVAVVGLNPLGQYSEKEIAKRISHEAGHLYGLGHYTTAAAILGDWIMAPQRSATRYIWHHGSNDSNRAQDDMEQLARLLIRRPDEPLAPRFLRMGSAPTIESPSSRKLYAHRTLETPNDIDEFMFTVDSAGPVAFTILGGIWADPTVQNPDHGSEANFRPSFQVRSEDGRLKLACPDSTTLTLSATTDQNITPSASPSSNDPTVFPCPSNVLPLQVGKTYRVWVTRHLTNRLPGNLGRYTILVSGPVRGARWPGFPIAFERIMWRLECYRLDKLAPSYAHPLSITTLPDLQVPIQHAVTYLQNEYNAEIGLIRESPETAPHKYWLATDNWLAARALRPYDRALADKLTGVIQAYGGVEHGLIEALAGDVVTWPPHVEQPNTVAPQGVKVEQRDGEGKFLDWAEYSDLALYKVLNMHNKGHTEAARQLYYQALEKFNGVGFADKAWLANNYHYATYKLALALYVGAQLGETRDRAILIALLRKQRTSGGFMALYDSSGKPVNDTNTETTAYALLALHQLAGIP